MQIVASIDNTMHINTCFHLRLICVLVTKIIADIYSTNVASCQLFAGHDQHINLFLDGIINVSWSGFAYLRHENQSLFP